MENEERERLAERLLEAGALRLAPGETPPLTFDPAALGKPTLRADLTAALTALLREHYPAAEAVLGGAWAGGVAEALSLPFNPAEPPLRPVLVAGSLAEAAAGLDTLLPLRKKGGSPAAAAVWNGREEAARIRLDRADVRCHWLTDLEAAAAAALRSGQLDFEDYCRLLPPDAADYG